MGLFSAGRGEVGGKMGVRDEEEREEGKPGEGVRGVAGLEGGNGEGLEVVSSVELRDSLRMWVYLVFCTSSMMNLQSFSFFVIILLEQVHSGCSDSTKVFLFHNSEFFQKGHSFVCLFVCPPLVARQPKPSCFKTGFIHESRTRDGAAEKWGLPVNGRIQMKKVHQCTGTHVLL